MAAASACAAAASTGGAAKNSPSTACSSSSIHAEGIAGAFATNDADSETNASDHVIGVSMEHDLAGFFELAQAVDDAHLRLLDVGLSRRAKHLDLFLERRDRALR